MAGRLLLFSHRFFSGGDGVFGGGVLFLADDAGRGVRARAQRGRDGAGDPGRMGDGGGRDRDRAGDGPNHGSLRL